MFYIKSILPAIIIGAVALCIAVGLWVYMNKRAESRANKIESTGDVEAQTENQQAIPQQ